MPLQRVPEELPVIQRQTFTTHHYQIKAGQIFLVIPETLSDRPLDEISVHCQLEIFLGYRHSQAGLRQAIRSE